MRTALIFATVLAVAATPALAGFPYNGIAPIPADAATMALAARALGKPCRFAADKVGPQIAGFTNAPGVGQTVEPTGTVFVRRRGTHRVAFMARDDSRGCKVLAAEALPPRAAAEAFLQCRVDDPDPDAIPPISAGLGLRQNGRRALAAYLEADFAHARLIPRDGSDKRIRCSDFESGD